MLDSARWGSGAATPLDPTARIRPQRRSRHPGQYGGDEPDVGRSRASIAASTSGSAVSVAVARGGSGAVEHQDVDLAERVASRREQPLGAVRVGQVDLDPDGPGHLAGDLPGAIAPPPGDDDVRALRGQCPGDRLAQPAGGGTDDGCAAGDTEVHRRASSGPRCRPGAGLP